MRRLEIDLLFKDLEYLDNEISIKKGKLDTIINIFMDDEREIAEDVYGITDDDINDDGTFKTVEDRAKENNGNVEVDNNGEEIPEPDNDDDDTEPMIDDDIQNDYTELSSEMKMLYRKIVVLTHPDKVKENKDYYISLYKAATEAKDNNDKAEIIYIAYKLNIKELYDIEDYNFGILRKKIKENQIISKKLEYNSFWIWYHTDNKSIKEVMREQIKNKKI